MTEKQQILIDEVMDNFDFEKVHLAMVALDWKWATVEGRVPEIPELKKNARSILKDAIKSSVEKYNGDGVTCATGGFYGYYNDKTQTLRLYFAVDQWGAYVDDEDGEVKSV